MWPLVRAVSRRASSSVFVGEVARLLEGDTGVGESNGENVLGIIFPTILHLFFDAAGGKLSGVSLGSWESLSSFVSAVSECLTDGGDGALFGEVVMPSKPRKMFACGARLSLRIIRRRRPGAG